MNNFRNRFYKLSHSTALGESNKKVTNMQEYLKVFYDNNIKTYAYYKTSNNKPYHASVLVENRYNYVSNFLKKFIKNGI